MMDPHNHQVNIDSSGQPHPSDFETNVGDTVTFCAASDASVVLCFANNKLGTQRLGVEQGECSSPLKIETPDTCAYDVYIVTDTSLSCTELSQTAGGNPDGGGEVGG